MVNAAAGAVGSVVGQIAKIKGCRVVGEYTYVVFEEFSYLFRYNASFYLKPPISKHP